MGHGTASKLKLALAPGHWSCLNSNQRNEYKVRPFRVAPAIFAISNSSASGSLAQYDDSKNKSNNNQRSKQPTTSIPSTKILARPRGYRPSILPAQRFVLVFVLRASIIEDTDMEGKRAWGMSGSTERNSTFRTHASTKQAMLPESNVTRIIVSCKKTLFRS